MKYPIESTSAAASLRAASFLSDLKVGLRLGGFGELAAGWRPFVQCCSRKQGPDRHNHPAACSCCAKRAMTIECPPASTNPSSNPKRRLEYGPADRQHFLTLGVDAPASETLVSAGGPRSSSVAPLSFGVFSRCDRLGRHLRSILPETASSRIFRRGKFCSGPTAREAVRQERRLLGPPTPPVLGRPGAFLANRRRGDECDERLVLIVEDSGLDLAELPLRGFLDRLRLDAVPRTLSCASIRPRKWTRWVWMSILHLSPVR